MASHDSRRIWIGLCLILLIALALVPGLASAQGTRPPTPNGTYYIVQRGDNWSMIAFRNGLTLAQLRAANPQYLRPGDVLWPGDRLFIPLPGGAPAATGAAGSGYWYTVRRGDTWQTIARDTNQTVLDLWHANPGLASRSGSLLPGTRLWIPGPAAQAPRAAATATPAEATAEAPAPTEAPTAAQPTPLPTVPPSPTAAPPPTAAVPTVSANSNCPQSYGDYPSTITDYLNSANSTAAGLRLWLAGCRAITAQEGSVTEAPIQSPGSDDYLVVLADPTAPPLNRANRLLVYHGLPTGYMLTGIAEGQGQIRILRVADLNADGKTDVVWTDTTCESGTCRSTLFVDSWDGTGYRSYIEGQPVTPAAAYHFEPIPGFKSQAIIIRSAVPSGSTPSSATYVPADGGVYRLLVPRVPITPTAAAPGGAAAKPESTATPAATPVPQVVPGPTGTGAPTESAASTVESTSTAAPPATPMAGAGATQGSGECLFDRIKAADLTFEAWPTTGFDPAIQAYQAIVDDTASRACGNLTDELAVLHDFARFRLMVSLGGNGKISQAPAIRDQINTFALKAAADKFLSSYQDSGSLVQACRDTSTYAAAHPDSWRFMVNLGDTSFTADDLCPLAK